MNEKMKPGGVDLILTSPPYSTLRNYEQKEVPSVNISELAPAFMKILNPMGGTLVWNIMDVLPPDNTRGKKWGYDGLPYKQVLEFMEAGFSLHQTIIWDKGNSAFTYDIVNKRYWVTYEYVFVLTTGKQAPKAWNPLKDRVNKTIHHDRQVHGAYKRRNIDGNQIMGSTHLRTMHTEEYGYRTDIWKIPRGGGATHGEQEARTLHSAVFPEELARSVVLTYSDRGDLVYDPFCGSGTTCVLAKKYGRKWLGTEINQKYVDYAKKRVALTSMVPEALDGFLLAIEEMKADEEKKKKEEEKEEEYDPTDQKWNCD